MSLPSPAPQAEAGLNTSARAATNTTAATAGVKGASAPTSIAPTLPPSPLSNTKRGSKRAPAPALSPDPHALEFNQELPTPLRQRLHELAALLYQHGALEIECVVNSFIVVTTSGDDQFELDAGHWLMVRVPGHTDLTQPARFQLKQE